MTPTNDLAQFPGPLELLCKCGAEVLLWRDQNSNPHFEHGPNEYTPAGEEKLDLRLQAWIIAIHRFDEERVDKPSNGA